MKNLPTLRNDSSFVVQFNDSYRVSKTRAILLLTMKIVETPLKHARHAIHWISNGNPDKISHNYTKLCKCLNNQPIEITTLGFSKSFLRWLKSYLSDRSHILQIDDRTSESVNVRLGVPQGSILGPRLFILYVSELQDHLPSSIGSFQYADDTTIYSSCPAPELQRCAQ